MNKFRNSMICKGKKIYYKDARLSNGTCVSYHSPQRLGGQHRSGSRKTIGARGRGLLQWNSVGQTPQGWCTCEVTAAGTEAV